MSNEFKEIMEQHNLTHKTMNHQGILIIDDNEICCLMLKDRLKMLGLPASYTTDGSRSLELIHQTHPKLIILDIFMPEFDGFEVNRALQKDKDKPYIISISSDPVWLECMMHQGANESYLRSDIDSIISAVKNYFMIHSSVFHDIQISAEL